MKYTADSTLEARLRDLGIEVIQIDLAVPPRPYTTLPLRARRAGRELRRRGIDLVHTFDYGDSYTEAIAVRSAGARYVSTKKNMGWGSRAWFLRSLFSDRIAVQNEQMFRQFFRNPLLQNRTRYIPRGVVLTTRPTRRAEARAVGIPTMPSYRRWRASRVGRTSSCSIVPTSISARWPDRRHRLQGRRCCGC